MASDLSFHCSCGQFQAKLHDPATANGNRLICYCEDCQAFAHYLQRADEILDANGGSDIFQLSPARLEITQGTEHVASIRLTPKGIMRWYTKCCNTPIGNTAASANVPFIGVLTLGMQPQKTLDEALGPVRGRVFVESAKGDKTNIKGSFVPLMLLKFGSAILKARLRGDHKKSPLFDAQTQQPIVEPHVLTADELNAVEAARDA